MSTAGTVLHEYALPPGTDGTLAFGPDGSLWVSEYWNNENHPDEPVGADHRPVHHAVPDRLRRGHIAVAPDGDGLVRRRPAHRGRRLARPDHPGRTVSAFPFRDSGEIFRGLVVGPDGNVWAGGLEVGAIAEIDPSGQLLATYAIPTPGSQPYSLAVGPDGNVWFGDGAEAEVGRVNASRHGDRVRAAAPGYRPVHDHHWPREHPLVHGRGAPTWSASSTSR